jgi:hypothetical protein
LIALLAGTVGVITAIATGTLALFIAATVVAGADQGVAIGAATRGPLHGSTLADRAPIFSVIHLICYGVVAFPSLISGRLPAPSRYRRSRSGTAHVPPSPPCSLSCRCT